MMAQAGMPMAQAYVPMAQAMPMAQACVPMAQAGMMQPGMMQQPPPEPAAPDGRSYWRELRAAAPLMLQPASTTPHFQAPPAVQMMPANAGGRWRWAMAHVQPAPDDHIGQWLWAVEQDRLRRGLPLQSHQVRLPPLQK